MFHEANQADFERMLDDILGRALTAAGIAGLEVEAQFIRAGGISNSNSRLPIAIEQKITPFHESALSDAMRLLVQFADRTAIPIPDLTAAARPKLAVFTDQLTQRMVQFASRMNLTQAIAEFKARFAARVDHALQDVEIGFIQGNSAVMTEAQTSQAKALRLLKAIYDHTHGRNEPIFVAELTQEAGLTEAEGQSAWRYLKGKHLIDTFNIDYTARINGAGEDVIEQAQRNPDRTPPNFPAITYNVVNNIVGTAINSPVQQASAHAAQTTTYSADDRAELVRLVAEFNVHLAELKLASAQEQKARAQIATLEAQLTDEPDHVIVRQAGRTLRNVTEGVIASLVATAAQPSVWAWVQATMTKLF